MTIKKIEYKKDKKVYVILNKLLDDTTDNYL